MNKTHVSNERNRKCHPLQIRKNAQTKEITKIPNPIIHIHHILPSTNLHKIRKREYAHSGPNANSDNQQRRLLLASWAPLEKLDKSDEG